MSEYESYQQAQDALRAAGLDPAKHLAAYDGPTPEEAIMQSAQRSVRSGGTPPGEEPPAPLPGAESFQKLRQAGVRTADAAAYTVDRLVAAAAAGDQRAIYDPDRDRGQADADLSRRVRQANEAKAQRRLAEFDRFMSNS